MFGISTGAYVLLAVLSVTSSVLVGLVAVWAALGKRPHWSVRCGLLLGVIFLGLLIPAHELVAMFFVQSMVVVGALAVYRMFQRRPDGTRHGFQFSLLDILLFTALTALVMAAACSTSKGTWTQGTAWFLVEYQYNAATGGASLVSPHEATFYLSFAIMLGFATLIGCWAAMAKSRLWMKLLVMVLVFAIAGLANYFHNFRIVFASYWPYIPAVTAVAISAWLFLARSLSRPAGHTSQISLGRWACRLAWATLSLAILLPTAGTLYFMATPPPVPQITLPEPNAYDTFVRVGRKLENITIPDIDMPGTVTKQLLAAFERKTDDLLTQAHEALPQEFRSPMIYNETGAESYMINIMAIRQLGKAFVVQGYTAHMNGNDTKAVECYLATMRLGKAVARRGLYVGALVGAAFEGIGLGLLHDLLTSLSDEQLSELAKTLRSMQNHDEPLQAFIAREEIAMYYIQGWEGRLQLMFHELIDLDLFSLETMENVFKRRLSSYRIMLIEIALTQYRNKHGSYPQKLDALVGEFLDQLPEDPHGAGGFIYRKENVKSAAKGKPGFKLYSLGPNRQDDTGNANVSYAVPDDVGFF